MCDVLKEIYRKVYTESFDYAKLEHRIKMQKAVYLLENMGVHVGDYSFAWDKYGPYSLSLDSDAKKCSKSAEQEVVFSQVAEKAFAKIREFILQANQYSCERWMECIAALHYLINVLRLSGEESLTRLEELKPYLSNREENEKALSITEGIRIGF